MHSEALLAEYDRRLPTIEALLADSLRRVSFLLESHGVPVHAISGRVKSRESLKAKLARPDKTYASLEQVTDLVGLRVTTYFEDTVEKIGRLIEQELAVNFRHFSDRRPEEDSSVFGYRSVHYVCESEAGLNFEVQLRTILQHAWAEIEHDLGYKSTDPIPGSVRRRFSRLAGLLEIADEEFMAIRDDLSAYAKEAREAASDATSAFPLDLVSLESLADSRELVQLDRDIAELLGKDLSAELFFPRYLLKMLQLAGYRSTREVREDVARRREEILGLVPRYFEFTRSAWKLAASDLESVPAGYGLFFLSHAAVLRSGILERNKVTKLAQFYRELDYPNDEAAALAVAEKLVEKLLS